MSEPSLLSDLCSICYTEKPKYRCPRCKTQTCSLPCYKKHQQRASCSGKRDPAAYLKKSEWATPAGIDQDYNYLKGVERNIDHASQDASSRGIGVSASVSKNVARGRRPDSMLQKYLNKNRITVERAPPGMSRQKTNLTRPTKRNHIVWTVEWIDSDGSRTIQNDCLESMSVRELYDLSQVEKMNSKQRQIDTPDDTNAQRGMKRKRAETKPGAEGSEKQGAAEAAPPSDEIEKKDNDCPEASSSDPVPIVDAPQDGEAPIDDEKKADGHSTSKIDEDEDDPVPTSVAESGEKDDSTNQYAEPVVKDELFFYLLRPNTATPQKVIIPTPSTQTLTESLHDKTVLEYPTIVVLSQDTEDLPKGYVLSSKYERAQKSKPQPSVKPPSGDACEQTEPEDDVVDAQGILDMLKRDVRG